MKALFYMGPNKMELRDIEKPSSDNEGVVVKIIEAGICGTDIKTYQRGHHLFEPPAILGHECYGVVSEKPSFVNNVDVGDYVVVAPYGECNVCEICRKGFPELCKNKTLPINSKVCFSMSKIPSLAITVNHFPFLKFISAFGFSNNNLFSLLIIF